MTREKTTFEKLHYIIYSVPVILMHLISTELVADTVLTPKFLALTAFLIFAFIYLFKKEKKSATKHSFLLITIGGYVIYSLSRSLFSPFIGDALFDASKLTLLFAFVFFYSRFTEKGHIKNIVFIYTAISSIGVIWGLIQMITVFATKGLIHSELYAMKSCFAHKNIFSEIILLSLPLSVFSAIVNTSWKRIYSILYSGIVFLVIVLSMTRAVWVGFGIAVIGSLLFIALNKKYLPEIFENTVIRKIKIFSAIVISSLILTVGIYSVFDTNKIFYNQIKNAVNLKYASVEERVVLWKNSFELYKKNPVFGSGQGTWRINILQYENEKLQSKDSKTFYQRPHNDTVWIIVEQGIVGLIFYLGIFALAIILIIKNIRSSDDFESKLLMLFCLFGIISFLGFSQFSFPRERIEHIVYIGILFSFIIVHSNNSSGININNRIIILISILLLAFAGYIGKKRLTGEMHLKNVLYLRMRNKNPKIIEEINKAENYLYTIDAVSTPLKWYRGSAYFELGKIDRAFADFKDSYKLNPYHVHVLNNIGVCYETMKQHDSALVYFDKALNITPEFEDALFNKTATLFNMGNPKGAYNTFLQIDSTTTNPKYMRFKNTIRNAALK